MLSSYQGNLTAARQLLSDAPINSDDRPFVEDGEIYTSRSAGDAITFGLGLASRFAGRERAVEVAQSICLDKDAVP